MDKPQRYGRCILGSSPSRTTKIRTYVVVVANDLAMVEAPDRTRIGALKILFWIKVGKTVRPIVSGKGTFLD